MNSRTSLLLVLLLAAIAGIAYWSNRGTDPIVEAAPGKLFAGVSAPGLQKLRLEHTRRGLLVTLERRDDGWWITDPVEHPAEAGVIGLFAQMIEFNELIPITQESPDLADLGFEPPVGLIDVTSDDGTGKLTTKRIEMGNADLDGRHVYVRVDGKLGRTVRNITNTLERNLDEFRSTRALVMDPGQIVEVHRTGYDQRSMDSERVDLDFSAFLDGTNWVATAPVNASLDPRMLEVVCRATTFLPILRHIEDVPQDLTLYGLEQPWWRIALRTHSGEERALLFGRASVGSSRWFAKREGQTAVFEVDGLSILELLRPLGELLDLRVLQQPKSWIIGVEYRTGDDGVLLAREGASWTVAPWAGDDWGAAEAADPTRVADLLDRLSQSNLRAPQWGSDAPSFEPAGTLRLSTNEETTQIAIGADPSLFQRAGEDVVFHCEDWLHERLTAPLNSWRSLQLLQLDEVNVSALTLSRDGVERRFERSDRGLWTRAGETGEARDLLKVMDALLFLRGKGHVANDGEPLARAIDGVFELRDGGTRRFSVGLAKDDRGVLREAVEVDGQRALVGAVGLHARLAGIVAE
ncbi:MAG: DUF4340 domain-containing protein [Planctomycetes bacterium]|nr:DUF4340 domain-containing protein [Planctomycetota bacterium]